MRGSNCKSDRESLTHAPSARQLPERRTPCPPPGRSERGQGGRGAERGGRRKRMEKGMRKGGRGGGLRKEGKEGSLEEREKEREDGRGRQTGGGRRAARTSKRRSEPRSGRRGIRKAVIAVNGSVGLLMMTAPLRWRSGRRDLACGSGSFSR